MILAFKYGHKMQKWKYDILTLNEVYIINSSSCPSSGRLPEAWEPEGSAQDLSCSQQCTTSGQRSQILFLVSTGATNPFWGLQLPVPRSLFHTSHFFQLFLQPLVFLLFTFLLSDVAVAWDGHIHHCCRPLMIIHHHDLRLISRGKCLLH